MIKNISLILLLGFCVQSQASVVGVADSGFYSKHELIKNNVWVNAAEMANRIDDDQNGLVDDVYGWNFGDNSKFLFEEKHISKVDPLVYKFMSIAAKMTGGIATDEEKEFIQKNLIDLPEDQKLKWITRLNDYGQYAHGTHVAGVVLKANPMAEVMNLRVFPTAAAPSAVKAFSVVDKIKSVIFGFIAQVNSQAFSAIADYVSAPQTSAEVVNMSLGVPMERLAEAALKITGNAEPTMEEIAAESQKIYQEFEKEGRKWLEKAPNTLFVVAAGNSGLDNDVIPGFPANVDVPNVISVAATTGVSALPEFSNYGEESVDVAAPGVAIVSSVPGPSLDFELEMTGTSMAAPYVAGVASQILDQNQSLTSVQIKDILMGTVDKKDFLQNKVLSGGVINAERAVLAARLSLDSSIEEAISQAKLDVMDQVESLQIQSRSNLSKEQKEVLKHLIF